MCQLPYDDGEDGCFIDYSDLGEKTKPGGLVSNSTSFNGGKIPNIKIREFDTGATRDTDNGKIDFEGFLSSKTVKKYEEWFQKQKEYAWAAGLFEGEGCILITKQKARIRKDGTSCKPEGYKYPTLAMSLTDEDVIRKFCIIVDGGTIGGPYIKKENNKPIWEWKVRNEAAKKVAEKLLPFLGNRRFMKFVEVFGIETTAILSGFHPLVLTSFGNYMLKHQYQSDGSLRSSDNWKKGIPKEAYMKSLWRHFHDLWMEHNGYKSREGIEDALCAILFNSMGYLHEVLMDKQNRKEV